MGIHSTTWYRPRVKFCGLTRADDVDAACEAGADLIGFVQVPASKRHISAQNAAKLASLVNRRASVVVLFMDADEQSVRQVVETVRPDLLQFHGNETPAFCQRFQLPWIKALATGGREPGDVARQARAYSDAHYLLLDGHAPGEMGGSGHRVADATANTQGWPSPVMLAGGLTPESVADAVEAWRPAALDVSSGIEQAPGIKDHDRMQAFLSAVAAATDAINKRHDHD